MTSLMVFTRDLRVDDNPALCAAANTGTMSCLFVVDDKFAGGPGASQRRQTFLLQSLSDLDQSLHKLGTHLEVVYGDWSQQVQQRALELGASNIHLSEDYSFYAKRRLANLKNWCRDNNISLHAHPGITAVPPNNISPAGGGEYKVFTPYWRSWLKTPKRPVLSAPASINATAAPSSSSHLAPDPFPNSSLIGGESEGYKRLQHWLKSKLGFYAETRDYPATDETSHLSPYLHFGCISPLRLVEQASQLPDSEPFIRQVVWRDFYAQILNMHPTASRHDYRDRGDVWQYDPAAYESWVEGNTGFPLVDAGMRQLKAVGFMHNRVRMVTASFLVKDLHQDWRRGADYFMSQLLDGDVASNYLNWQWVAGTGTDSNPHRILNPTTQAQRFDRKGKYIQKWVPELSDLTPSQAIDPPYELREKTGYPLPIVDHHKQVEMFKQRRLAANQDSKVAN